MKKTRGKLLFFIFRKIFGALEAKMMKNDKKMKKMKKKWKKMKKTEGKLQFFIFWKIAIFLEFVFHFFNFFFIFFSFFFHFFIIFHYFSSFFINSTTGSKNDKKMIKKWKNSRKIAFFLFFGKFLEHWKQKWWNMIKKWKKWKNWGKIAIFHFLENCNFPRVCFSFFFIFFHFFFHFFIIFHNFSSFFIDSTTGSKNDKTMIKKW